MFLTPETTLLNLFISFPNKSIGTGSIDLLSKEGSVKVKIKKITREVLEKNMIAHHNYFKQYFTFFNFKILLFYNMKNTQLISVNELRETFINYFVENGHTKILSSPLIPSSDPSLLFTNSGMVQFKDIFMGNKRPTHSKVVTSQKCLRALRHF